jgi:ABC-type molybdate transport system permease subunit
MAHSLRRYPTSRLSLTLHALAYALVKCTITLLSVFCAMAAVWVRLNAPTHVDALTHVALVLTPVALGLGALMLLGIALKQ